MKRAVPLLLTLVFGVYGVWGVVQRVQFEAPVAVACYPREFEGHRWVRVSQCEYKQATLKQGSDGTWVVVEHINGLHTEPFLVHAEGTGFIDPTQVGALLSPFFARVTDVPAGYPDLRLALEVSNEEPVSPSLIWPIVSLVGALFWLAVTIGGLLPRK